MIFLPVIGFFVAITAIAIVVIKQVRLKKEEKELNKRVTRIISFEQGRRDEVKVDYLSGATNGFFIDIETDLERSFNGEFIPFWHENQFTRYYSYIFEEAYSLHKKLKTYGIKPSGVIMKFIYDYQMIPDFVKEHNRIVARQLLETHKEFFDHCLKYPLDRQQRRSIVSEEDNCLVVSSAGSGKTSSIVGKVKYLTEIKHIDPTRILLISYTNKAAAELTERIATPGLRGYTFHKLALDLIGQTTGEKPSICDNTDALFVKIYKDLSNDPRFMESVVKYFGEYQIQEADWERRKNERREQLSEQKKAQIKALFPDMDGKAIYVRSQQEQAICFALSSLGVRFRYEEPYEHELADEMHSQYRPDFSIYFEQNGKYRRIYLEHFGVNARGVVPVWFSKDRGISYDEANRQYTDSIAWKKAAHKKFGTKLLTTTSADFQQSDIKDILKTLLVRAGVPIYEKSDEELYNLVLPKGSKQEKVFIRLVATFIALLKSSCKSADEVLRQAKREQDERSVFIIKNIFLPVYKRYADALKAQGQIDFTEVILQATDLCRAIRPVEYDYIIVDEFQDISIDRYNFLKALREGNPPAKLYCVGDDWQSIYRFSGSDMALFNQFPDYFGATEINKIETTYRFGEPLVALSSQFIQCNDSQIRKRISPFSAEAKTELEFLAYDRANYCNTIGQIISQIPPDKSIFLLGRYSFDDYYLSFTYKTVKRGHKVFYKIGDREIEFLTAHKSKGLEADYVILLQCNKDTYGFPSLISDDYVLNYVLTENDKYPYGEERRLFYVAITRAKNKTIVLYDKRFPSVFVDEFLYPEKQDTEVNYTYLRNAGKRWTQKADKYLLDLHRQGKSVKYIATKMGRSQTSIVMRFGKLSN
jgi:DNA helicase-4